MVVIVPAIIPPRADSAPGVGRRELFASPVTGITPSVRADYPLANPSSRFRRPRHRSRIERLPCMEEIEGHQGHVATAAG